MSRSGHVLGPLKVITSLTNCTNPESATVFTKRKLHSSWGSNVSKMKQLGKWQSQSSKADLPLANQGFFPLWRSSPPTK